MSNKDEGAREALVEQLAEAIVEAALSASINGWAGQAHTSRVYAEACLPVVAAQVEAAVSVVRAERDEVREDVSEYDGILSRQGDLLTRTVNVLRGDPPPLTSWSHHDVPELARGLADQMAKVKALAAEHDHCSGCPTPWWLRAALSDPTTPDQAGGE